MPRRWNQKTPGELPFVNPKSSKIVFGLLAATCGPRAGASIFGYGLRGQLECRWRA